MLEAEKVDYESDIDFNEIFFQIVAFYTTSGSWFWPRIWMVRRIKTALTSSMETYIDEEMYNIIHGST